MATFAAPAFGQGEIKDLNYLAPFGAVEPGDDTGMLGAAPPALPALGSGIVVMKFEICDVDPLADDPSDIIIDEFIVDNLGSATDLDIEEVMILEDAGFDVGAAGAITTTAHPTAGQNIGFQAIIDANDHVIPDNQCETFSVAVKTFGTDTLPGDGDDSHRHTIRLRVTVVYAEAIGSPRDGTLFTNFTEVVTDGAPEFVCNCGVNRVSDDMYVVNPLMPGMMGVVSRFTACDEDSNEDNLNITQITLKQGDMGNAEFPDIATIKVFRVESSGRSQLAAFTPTAAFNRDGAGDAILDSLIGSPGHAIIITDDSCAVFEVEAEVSQYAFKGRLIQLEFDLSTEEPRGTQVGVGVPANPVVVDFVDPEIQTNVPTPIGKGMVVLPSTIVLASPGDIAVGVAGIPIPGLGTLQVGPTGAFTFDPSVIQILEIVGVGDYVVEAVDIDNRRGLARFSVRIDPAEAKNGISNGTVAIIRVDGVGDPGERTLLGLNYDIITDSANIILSDANNPLTISNVGVVEGEVRLVPPGDVDGDGFTTVRDALLLADQLIQAVPCNSLSDEQKTIADVSAPFSDIDDTPTCSGDDPTLTSADVAQIAKLAITGGGVSSSAVEAARVMPLNVSQIMTAARFGSLEFRVQGAGITSMEVDMFSLSGQHILNDQAAGNRLMVRAQDSYGRQLANGVYLYTVTVYGANNEAIRSEIKKMVILR